MSMYEIFSVEQIENKAFSTRCEQEKMPNSVDKYKACLRHTKTKNKNSQLMCAHERRKREKKQK